MVIEAVEKEPSNSETSNPIDVEKKSLPQAKVLPYIPFHRGPETHLRKPKSTPLTIPELPDTGNPT